MNMNTRHDIEEAFTYHAPQGDQPARYQKIREAAKAVAVVVLECVPAGRERALALTKLQEASMWANAGVALNPDMAPDR